MSGVPTPAVRVTLDGTDLTDRIRPRLVSLTLSEKRGGEADQLDMVIDATDGRVALPRAGVTITVAIGWAKGQGVAVGLVNKGRFVVDEVEFSGPPDLITVRARAADLTGGLTQRREKSWHDTTIGAIVNAIALRHKLRAHCAAALSGVAIKSKNQGRESDLAFLRRLGREYDAVATIKDGALVFAPIGAGVTASGKPIPSHTVRRGDGDRFAFRVEKREESAGVTATWHDRKAGKKKSVTVGDEKGARKLQKTYASEAQARRAAEAEQRHRGRQPLSLELALAYGNPALAPEQRIRAEGFPANIDAIEWLASEVTHELNDGRFSTRLKLETPGQKKGG